MDGPRMTLEIFGVPLAWNWDDSGTALGSVVLGGPFNESEKNHFEEMNIDNCRVTLATEKWSITLQLLISDLHYCCHHQCQS